MGRYRPSAIATLAAASVAVSLNGQKLTNVSDVEYSAPPPDPTTAFATNSPQTYYDVTAAVTSTQDSTITDLHRRVVYCQEYAAIPGAEAVVVLLLPGIGAGLTTFPTGMMQRLAGAWDAELKRYFVVVACTARGRGNGGTSDWWHDTWDYIDLADDATSVVEGLGVTVHGSGSFVVAGYSTGALDAALLSCRAPDRVMARVLVVPNFDIGKSEDSYYNNQSTTNRATLGTEIGVRGFASRASLAPYLGRNPIDGLVRILRLQGSGPCYVGGDSSEAHSQTLPNPLRLVRALKSVPGRLHQRITTSNDSVRILHVGAPNNAGCQSFENQWVPGLLRAEPWAMPSESPPGGLRLLGWMAWRALVDSDDPADDRPAVRIAMGGTVTPWAATTIDNKVFCGELTYRDTSTEYIVKSVVPGSGYVEVLRLFDQRVVAISGDAEVTIDLDVAPTIASFTDMQALGWTRAWASDVGVNASGTDVTTVENQIGGPTPTLAGSGTGGGAGVPQTGGTDAQGVAYIGCSGASHLAGQYLKLTGLLFNPKLPATVVYVGDKRSNGGDNSSARSLFGMGHTGTSNEFRLTRNSAFAIAQYNLDSGSTGLSGSGDAGVSEALWTASAKHFVAGQRYADAAGASHVRSLIDGSAWGELDVLSDSTWTTTGTTNSVFCGAWVNGVPWLMPLESRFYLGAVKPAAASLAEVLGVYAFAYGRFISP